ncbi:MAG: PrsW family intramembrane metalloprotease [Melioribacteraceae bacterium]|nr:PrsW family intramembrane metalloprotease [Melioribacteraceae bacterium]
MGTFITGGFCAAAAYFANTFLIETSGIGFMNYSQFAAPVVEELLKLSIIVVLIRQNKIGFMIDAAILGFAVGAGFAVVENYHYLFNIASGDFFVLIVRGFGTAIMHSGTTSLFAVISVYLIHKNDTGKLIFYVPGFAAAVVFHSIFNQFVFSPFISTIFIISTLPAFLIFIFYRNTNSIHNWLEVELDNEARLLTMIKGGRFAQSKTGRYIINLREKFQKEIVFDMVCYVQLYIELSILAKGILMMQESGFDVPKDPELETKLDELKSLEKRIGKSAVIAISPVLRLKKQDLWKLSYLNRG